jgi:pilus assembly protein Flp/PilA
MSTSLFFIRLLRDDRGATAIEYGLIVSLIAMAMIGAFSGIADENIGLWGRIQTKVSAATPG